MKIELKEITIKKLFDVFADNAEQGVVAYGGEFGLRSPSDPAKNEKLALLFGQKNTGALTPLVRFSGIRPGVHAG